MPKWLPENNAPSPGDTEVRSLWKINDLAYQWAVLQGVVPTIKYFRTIQPQPHDTEVNSLQKINACLTAISKTP